VIPALGTQDILIYLEDSYHNVRVMHLFALLCRAGGAAGGQGGLPPRPAEVVFLFVKHTGLSNNLT
jgi:hypothetical protein